MKITILTRLIWSLAIVISCIGCQKKDIKKYYYETGELLSEVEYNKDGKKDGQLSEYYKTGELKTREYYKNGKLIDTTLGFSQNGKLIVKRYEEGGNSIFERYYENGKLLSRGRMRDTIAEGWWDYYDNRGNLYKKVEYIDALDDPLTQNEQHPNQIISFDNNKRVLKDSSNYFAIDLKDTLPIGKVSLGYIDLEPQISKESDFHMVYFWSQDKNGNKTNIDSTYGKNNKKAEFWLVPKTNGEHILEGYILEKGKIIRKNKKDTTLVDVIDNYKKLFFEKPFYVKDTASKGNE